MTATKWKVFVEGKADRRFVSTLLTALGVATVEVESIGGGVSHLRAGTVRNLLQRSRRDGCKIATVLDADEDVDARQAELDRINDEYDLAIERSFWLPNDVDSGCLETLLEEVAVEEHHRVFNCLDQYVECLDAFDRGYEGPTRKGRIYAYCEAVGAEKGEEQRDYTNDKHWDLSASSLQPLRAFLDELT
ncbi:MAG: hypothetical protein OXH08_12080 [Gammaproteobacteria bacterium]|nr:hypothetical protein [Gammaproteobacteria bacterium]MDE2716440.1 hypothetical protein [Chloroflexota bacterium]